MNSRKKIRIKTREEWLVTAAMLMRPLFKKHGAILPLAEKLMLGCGWPRGGKAEVIGQCFGKSWTSDGVTHIFISPTRGGDDLAGSVDVLAILLHELIHAAVGCEEGHRGRFKIVARSMGLEGKLTATYVSPGTELHGVLVGIAARLGTYPHSKMMRKGGAGVGGGKNGYKWPRLVSVGNSRYTFQMSPKVIAEFGLPLDPDGVRMMIKGEGGA